ncbi:MAG TPA: hypothetical protein VND15_02350 [Candidatus Acidoferrales bacterium]|nr:hypothetical protein [Candidatus Acidoferrales bacterium]
MTKIELPIITSAITMALVILVIGVFIHFGASAIFYTLLFIGIAFGFLNGWLISRHERMKEGMPPVHKSYTRIPERRHRAKKTVRK